MTEDGDRLAKPIPAIDTTNPAISESWFGPFGFYEYFRKVVLSNAREIERAKATAAESKTSESRLDDLAHTNSAYVSFLIEGLEGRRVREELVREKIGV